jgi:hypothetical protein
MRIWAPSPHPPHLARFSRDVGYHRPSPQARRDLHRSTGVPHVRTSVRGPKTMGEAHHSLSLQPTMSTNLTCYQARIRFIYLASTASSSIIGP